MGEQTEWVDGNILTRVINALNSQLVEENGHIGECCGGDEDPSLPGSYLVEVVWWPDRQPDAARLREIVRAAGGVNIWVSWHLVSEMNFEILGTGRSYLDGSAHLTIRFDDPLEHADDLSSMQEKDQAVEDEA